MLKVLAAGGGTKGHAFPLREILREIKKRDENARILIAGVKEFESHIAEELGAEFFRMNLKGLPRKINADVLKVPFRAILESARLFSVAKNFEFDFCIVTGGYSCFPVGMTGILLRKPIYIHEQNAVLGLTNRILAPFSRRIFLSLPLKNCPEFVKKKVVLSGNPVREEAKAHLEKKDACKRLDLKDGKPVILVFGGSQGAQSINEAALRLFKWLKEKEKLEELQFIWLTGKNNFDVAFSKIQEIFPQGIPASIRVFPEYENMGELYSCADLVLSRSGASTIAELIANGKKAVLVPYPHASENHQLYNALFLSERKAATVIPDKKIATIEPEELFTVLLKMLYDEEAKRASERLKMDFEKHPPQKAVVDIIFSDLKDLGVIDESS